jgi:hypothetical protein
VVSLHTTRFNIKKFYMVLALRWAFCKDLRTDSGLCFINWLVFITVVESVYSAVRSDCLYKVDCVSSFKVKVWSWGWGKLRRWRSKGDAMHRWYWWFEESEPVTVSIEVALPCETSASTYFRTRCRYPADWRGTWSAPILKTWQRTCTLLYSRNVCFIVCRSCIRFCIYKYDCQYFSFRFLK